ncbi:MAG: hypothetical protein OER95_02815 [Acidimicrobiia bacterium]|nr:hypothetical protein [Acidimicrobiia bacterium]
MNKAEQRRAKVEQLALDEHQGAISQRRAREIGVSIAQIDRRVRRHQWLPMGPQGWFALADQAHNPLASLFAATRALTGPSWGRSGLTLFCPARTPSVPSLRRRGATAAA